MNNQAATVYLQFFNKASVPIPGTDTPLYSFMVKNASDQKLGTEYFTNAGAHFSTGLSFGWSSDQQFFVVLSGSANTSKMVHYV